MGLTSMAISFAITKSISLGCLCRAIQHNTIQHNTTQNYIQNKTTQHIAMLHNQYLVGDGVDLNGDILRHHQVHQLRVFVQGVAVANPGRVEQDGVHQVVVRGRVLPVCPPAKKELEDRMTNPKAHI
eukprot:TRINITY_DN41483_c0_g1_i2.p1 TRINITY_DN41483_c0_g1~~TRINITY_DN41483_c0_g1_i2.p1  ORF type:complete len:127 (+),score=16.35 TRINITY_DN41483_c0_g1_i2:113-493(+)